MIAFADALRRTSAMKKRDLLEGIMHRYGRPAIVIVLLFGMFAGAAHADVRLPRVIGNHMVLQRDKPLKI